MKLPSLRFLAIASLIFSTSVASAQNAPAEAATTAPRETPPTAPTEGAPTDRTVDTGDAYSRAGGSLMRASKGAQAPAVAGGSQVDPRIADISFFAVPPPPRRIIRQHDLITIIVKEQSEFKSDGSTKLDKKADLSAAINQFIRLNLNNMELDNTVGSVVPKIDLEGEMGFDGKGTAERKDSLSVRMQAEVVDVKPNGNLVLQARRRIKTDDEDRVFLVSGMVRVQDVTTDNTVLSTQMYDFDLNQQTKGTVREATKRGWLPRLLDALNPF
jgi:flagellar L-ring protein precursor FlgH